MAKLLIKFKGEVPLTVNSKAFKSAWRAGWEAGANGKYVGDCPYIPRKSFWRSVYARYWKAGYQIGRAAHGGD